MPPINILYTDLSESFANQKLVNLCKSWMTCKDLFPFDCSNWFWS